MIEWEEIREVADKVHRENTEKVFELIIKEAHLTNLDKILDPDLAKLYQRILPRYAKLCKLDQQRGLDDTERAELAVNYASLYPTFGDDGIVKIAAAWLVTQSIRQARDN